MENALYFQKKENLETVNDGLESVSYSKIVNAKFICTFSHDAVIRANGVVMRSNNASTLQNKC